MKRFLGAFLGFFLTAYLFLFLSFAPTVWIESAHHDNTRYFRVSASNDFKSSCDNDSQYGWLHLIGRPVAAELECQVFKHTRSLADLGLLRSIVIGIIAASAAMLAILLARLGVDKLSAGLTAIAVFCLPGAQNTALMTNFPNALAPLISLTAYFLLLPVRVIRLDEITAQEILRITFSFSLLLLAMLVYPALAFTFFWAALAKTLLNSQSPKACHLRTAIRDILMFFLAAIVYLSLRTAFIPNQYKTPLSTTPEHFQADFSFSNLTDKLPHIFTDIFPSAASLWFIHAGWFSALVLFALTVSALLAVRGSNTNEGDRKPRVLDRPQMRIFVAFMLLVCTFAPLVLVKSTVLHQRVLFPGMGAIVIALICVVPQCVGRVLGRRFATGQLYRQFIAVLMIATGLVMASYATTLNVWNTNIEMEFVRAELAKYDPLPRRIHLIRAVDNGTGFNGLKSRTDEFNQKTTNYRQDIVDFIRLSLLGSSANLDIPLTLCDFKTTNCEMVVPRSNIIISISDYGESLCKSPDMAIVDLNVLVRATRTGNPKLLSTEQLPPCASGEFSVSTQSGSPLHDVSKAFDESVSPNDFWETSIVEPVNLYIDYRVAIALSSYKFSAGEAPERMPISWRLMASRDNQKWEVLDRKIDFRHWGPNKTETFEVKVAQEYRHYRFIFDKSLDPEILRIYEIKIDERVKEK